MTATIIALMTYVLSGLGLLAVFGCFVAPRLPPAAGRLGLVMLAVIIFTPGTSDEALNHIGPACIGVLFNLMAHSLTGVLRSLLPLVLVGSLAMGLLWWYEAYSRKDG